VDKKSKDKTANERSLSKEGRKKVYGKNREAVKSKFLARAKERWDGKYSYTFPSGFSKNAKVMIGCPSHGQFEMNPMIHLKGKGCPKCGGHRDGSKIVRLMGEVADLEVKNKTLVFFLKGSRAKVQCLFGNRADKEFQYLLSEGNKVVVQGVRTIDKQSGAVLIRVLQVKPLGTKGIIQDVSTVDQFYGFLRGTLERGKDPDRRYPTMADDQETPGRAIGRMRRLEWPTKQPWNIESPTLVKILEHSRSVGRENSLEREICTPYAALLYLRRLHQLEVEEKAIVLAKGAKYRHSLPKDHRWDTLTTARNIDRFFESDLEAYAEKSKRLDADTKYAMLYLKHTLPSARGVLVKAVSRLAFETVEDRRIAAQSLLEGVDHVFSPTAQIPDELQQLILDLADLQPDERVYVQDYGATRASLWLQMARRAALIAQNDSNNSSESFNGPYGLEIYSTAYFIAHVISFVEGLPNANFASGDALAARFKQEEFDCVVGVAPTGKVPKPKQNKKEQLDEILLERFMNSLAPGGRAVVLVFDGLLFRGGSANDLRKKLISKFCLEGVISLPADVAPKYTRAPMSLLVFRNAKPMENVYCRQIQSTKNLDNEVLTIKQRELDHNSWTVTADEIADRDWDLLAKRTGAYEYNTFIDSLLQADKTISKTALPELTQTIFGGVTSDFYSPSKKQLRTKVQIVSLDDIVEVGDLKSERGSALGRFRQERDKKLSELEESVKKQGVLHPISVLPLPDGKYRMVDGRLRWHASKRAGLDDIPALFCQILPVVGIQSIENGRLLPTMRRTVEREYPSERYLQNGDVLLSTTGTIGKVAVVDHKSDAVGGLAAKNLCVIRPIENLITPHYLAQILRSELVQTWLKGFSHGRTVQYISLERLRKLTIPTPASLHLQEQVVEESTYRRYDPLQTLNDLVIGQDEPISRWFFSSEVVTEFLNSTDDETQQAMLRLFESLSNFANDLDSSRVELRSLVETGSLHRSTKQVFEGLVRIGTVATNVWSVPEGAEQYALLQTIHGQVVELIAQTHRVYTGISLQPGQAIEAKTYGVDDEKIPILYRLQQILEKLSYRYDLELQNLLSKINLSAELGDDQSSAHEQDRSHRFFNLVLTNSSALPLQNFWFTASGPCDEVGALMFPEDDLALEDEALLEVVAGGQEVKYFSSNTSRSATIKLNNSLPLQYSGLVTCKLQWTANLLDGKRTRGDVVVPLWAHELVNPKTSTGRSAHDTKRGNKYPSGNVSISESDFSEQAVQEEQKVQEEQNEYDVEDFNLFSSQDDVSSLFSEHSEEPRRTEGLWEDLDVQEWEVRAIEDVFDLADDRQEQQLQDAIDAEEEDARINEMMEEDFAKFEQDRMDEEQMYDDLAMLEEERAELEQIEDGYEVGPEELDPPRLIESHIKGGDTKLDPTSQIGRPKNPYKPGPPVGDSKMLFGRDVMITKIQRELASQDAATIIVVEGNRRSGKSSILHRLTRPDVLSHCLVVNVDLKDLRTPESSSEASEHAMFFLLAERIQDACREETSTFDPSLVCPPRAEFTSENCFRLFENYVRLVRKVIPQRCIVLMLDEFNTLQKRIDRGEISDQVLLNFRSLVEKDIGFSLVISKLKSILREGEDYWSQLYGIGITVQMDPLSREDSIRLITEPVSRYFRYMPDARDYVVKQCHGRPYLIQALCSQIFNEAILKKEIITLPMVQNSSERLIGSINHFRTLWRMVSPVRRKLILALLSRFEEGPDSITYQFLTERLEDYGVNLREDPGMLGEDLATLMNLELLQVSKGVPDKVYQLDPPLWSSWIANEMPEDIQSLAAVAAKDSERLPIKP